MQDGEGIVKTGNNGVLKDRFRPEGLASLIGSMSGRLQQKLEQQGFCLGFLAFQGPVALSGVWFQGGMALSLVMQDWLVSVM